MTNRTHKNPERLIDSTWPFDGPHTEDSVEAAAVALGRLVRYLNNATGYSKSLPYVGTAYRVTSSVAHMAGLLPQLLNQLAQLMEQQANDPSLYDDRRNERAYPAVLTADRVAAELHGATQTVATLGHQLQRAANMASHLGNDEV